MEHRRREPAPGVFRLVLPLPFPGLDRVNAYLLDEESGATLVDSGIYDPSREDGGWSDLVAALAACGRGVEDLRRVILTHTHIDHYGFAARFKEELGCELWMHVNADRELDVLRDPSSAAEKLRKALAEHGVDEEDLDELTQFEDWRRFVSGIVDADRWLDGGESITVGDRTWDIVHTPGHARSHVCIFNERDSVLIAGDHLLGSITPHIDFERDSDEDPLGLFLDSLQRVEQLDPDLVLPGHGRPFDEGAERARVVERHHDRRLGAILQVVRKEPHTATEITDEIFGSTLLNFQRRLALGEALAHLTYLLKRGEVETERRDDGHILYRKVSRHRRQDDD
ncbi:MAG: MBL fold metallo-hydrolase [Actinobacteria bacterium]|nr:MBL fold metallo-hydrolase [Actinomycetota bacterium]